MQPTDRFQIAHLTDVLSVGARSTAPDDTLVLAVSQVNGYGGRSILLSRAQVRELHGFTGRWLDSGWNGVRQVEGPTTADVIVHYRDIAIRYQLDADHARADAARQVDAALALIPAENRGTDLAAVVDAQSRVWHSHTAQRDELEQLRQAWVQGLHEIAHSGTTDADALRRYAAKLLEAQHRIVSAFGGKSKPLPTTDAPVYHMDTLFDLAEKAA